MQTSGTIRQILANKTGSHVVAIHPGATVFDALTVMGAHNIGGLVVTEDDHVVGMITERDYSRKVVLHNRTSRDTLVSEILSQPVITIGPDDMIESCMELMSAHRIRHLPVVDGETLIGVVSIGDVVNWIMHSQHAEIKQLTGYIRGGYPA